MPTILKPEEEAKWLNLDTTPEQATELLQPYPDEQMQAYEVSTLINSPANNEPDVFKPLNSQ
jgi:putative SOS response-associated peptidase YedK